MKYINSARPVHQSTLSFLPMISYGQITNRIETSAKGCSVATLFTLPISTSVTLVLFLFTTILIVLSGQWKDKIRLIRTNPVALYCLGFYAMYLLGTLYSIGNAVDIIHQLLKFAWLLLTPLWITIFIEERWRTRAINAFLISMTITLLLSFIKYFQWISNPYFWHMLSHRLGTTTAAVFKDHIIQSFLMSLTAMIFLHRFIQQKRWIYSLFFLLAVINILFLSRGRTGYIIFILLLAYTTFSQLHFKRALLVCGVGIVVLATLLAVLPGAIHERATRAVQDIHQWDKGYKQTSLGYRMAWQRNAIELFTKRPIIGYGTGSIKAAYASLPQQQTAQTGIVDNTSNEYLNIAIQFGVIGLFVFLGMLLVQWRYSFYLSKECRSLIRTLLIALCVGNLANSWLMDVTQGHFYALMMAVAFGAYSTRQEPSTVKDRACNDDAAVDTPT